MANAIRSVSLNNGDGPALGVTKDADLELRDDESQESETEVLLDEVEDLKADEVYHRFCHGVAKNDIGSVDEKSPAEDPEFVPEDVDDITDLAQEDLNGEDTEDDSDVYEADEEVLEEPPIEDVPVASALRKLANFRIPFMWRTNYQLKTHEAATDDTEEDPNFKVEEHLEIEEEYISCEEEAEEEEEEEMILEDEEISGMIADLKIDQASDDEEIQLEQIPPLGQVFEEISEAGYKSDEDKNFAPKNPSDLNEEDSNSSSEDEADDESDGDQSDQQEEMEQ